MEVLWNNRGIQNLSTLFENLAASLTNNIRMTADRAESIPGESGTHAAIFRVRWLWILPTALSQLFAIIFLGVTWWKTKKTCTPLWKGSTLSVLFHGLSARLKRMGLGQILQSETNKEARGIVVQLEEMDGGICLGKASFPDFSSKKTDWRLVDGTALVKDDKGSMKSSLAPFENSMSESLLKLVPSP
jgi:hypothetical protein